MLIAKFCDHLPLYRQAEIYARDGVDLDRATLASWVGKAAWRVEPLADRIGRQVMAGSVIHADDTPVPVLAPGNGKTKEGRFWIDPSRRTASCRNARGGALPLHARTARVSAAASILPHSKAICTPMVIRALACCTRRRRQAGVGYGGGMLGACSRKFFDEYKSNSSPIAKDALAKIGELFEIERAIAGKPPSQRQAARLEKAKPKLDALAAWMDAQLQLISGKGDLAKAIRYARSRWQALTCYCADGRLEISNNAAENAVRPVSLGRKNWLFAGSDTGRTRRDLLHAHPLRKNERT